MASMTELRKKRFEQEQRYEDFLKLINKIEDEPSLFDEDFFRNSLKNSLARKDVNGLLLTAQIYVGLDRLIEAEYLLTQAYDLNESDVHVWYALIDVFCRRHSVFLAYHFLGKVENKSKDILYRKSLLKCSMMAGKREDIDECVQSDGASDVNDEEYTRLMLDAAFNFRDPQLMYIASKSPHFANMARGLSRRWENVSKAYLIEALVNILRRITQ